MKNLKRIVALMLVMVMALSLGACGKKGGSGSDNGGKEVEIAYWHAGLGIEWLEEMVNAFNSSQSDWNVKFRESAIKNSLTSALGMEDVDTTDLYIAGQTYDTQFMEPLEDLLDSTANGDKKTIREKMNPNYLATATADDGKVYTLSAGSSLYGIVYNKKLFKQAGIDVMPRTSDELVVACDKLLENGITPWAIFGTWAYWDFFVEAWQAQYDGYDYYLNNYHACTDINGGSPSKDVLTKKDGRWAVLRAMEKLITPDYVVDGAAAEDHITMQTKFLNTDIGMMVNGNWLTKEMSEVGSTDNFGLMKTPVISEITENLMTISDDETLRAVIDAIDEVIDDESKISKYKSGDDYVVDGQTISAIDWDYVMAARTTSPVGFSTAFIPKYSNAVEGAKEFLKFLCSDKGMEIYLKYTHISMPMEFSDGREYDTSDWNNLEKESDEVLRSTVYYATNTMLNRHPIFRAGGASSYVGVSVPQMMYTKNPADRMSADDVWTEMMRILEMKYEKDWLFNIK